MFLSDSVFSRVVTKDEKDFDKFLESVKAKQLSLTTKGVCTVYVRSSFDLHTCYGCKVNFHVTRSQYTSCVLSLTTKGVYVYIRHVMVVRSTAVP